MRRVMFLVPLVALLGACGSSSSTSELGDDISVKLDPVTVGPGEDQVYCQYLPADGKSRWVLTRGRVIADADGVRMAVGSNLDITDRKTAEERRSLVLLSRPSRATPQGARGTARQATT